MLLDVKSVDKKFNGVYALKGLDFSLGEGEIHGLIGENGAGKSTFIKILGGIYKRDVGNILWNGKDLPEVIRPEESRKLGINIIFQDNVLIPAFTGMENICLGRPYPVKGGLIQWKEMEREAAAKAAELGIHLDLKRPVSMMTPAQKKCVEIVRAMMSDCKLLILDEPTASLSDKETNLLFSIVRNLKAKGTSVLYVTHRLEEIMELTDRVTVLRNGTLVSTVDTAGTSRKELVRLMSGNEAASGVEDAETGKDAESKLQGGAADRISGKGGVKQPVSCEAEKTDTQGAELLGTGADGKIGKTALEVQGIRSGDGIVRGVDLNVKSGQITGMFGLCGSGRTEFLECIYGTRKLGGGEVTIDGKTMTRPTPSESIRQGMAFICEDRRGKAMIPAFSVEENMMLSSIDRYTKSGWFQKRAADKKAMDMIEALKIKCVGVSQPAKELSGGNQQKAVIAKWLQSEPKLLILDEPTRGIDVGAKFEIYKMMIELAKKGIAIIMISSELPEVMGMSDRIMVVSKGRITGTYTKDEIDSGAITQNKLLSSALQDV